MPLIRKQLKPSDVYPDTIRYNPDTDTVQVLIDDVWTDAPQSDPRTQTTLPPRITANTACDAAQSVADALEGQISGILTAIDNGATAFTIAGLILGLLSFGVFAIFISIALFIADQMLAAGTAAIEAALPPSAFDDLACILYCHMDANGRLSDGELPSVQADVTAQIGGLGATLLNGMLELAGVGGINNLAALGTSTGSCGGCGCNRPCLDESNIIIGTLAGITATTIDITAVLATYNSLTAYWAVYGGLPGQFCCYYCSFAVLSGGIDSGGLYDCSGGAAGGQGLKSKIEFYANAAPFTIRYTLDPDLVGCP